MTQKRFLSTSTEREAALNLWERKDRPKQETPPLLCREPEEACISFGTQVFKDSLTSQDR